MFWFFMCYFPPLWWGVDILNRQKLTWVRHIKLTFFPPFVDIYSAIDFFCNCQICKINGANCTKKCVKNGFEWLSVLDFKNWNTWYIMYIHTWWRKWTKKALKMDRNIHFLPNLCFNFDPFLQECFNFSPIVTLM